MGRGSGNVSSREVGSDGGNNAGRLNCPITPNPPRDTAFRQAQPSDYPCTLSHLGQREPRQCSWPIPVSSSALYAISWDSQNPLPLVLPCLPLTGSASPCRAVSGPGKRDLELG